MIDVVFAGKTMHMKDTHQKKKSDASATITMQKGHDISTVVQDNLCMGCGTCLSVCPTSAIELVRDGRRGCFVAAVNRQRCTSCGICFAVCPGHAVDLPRLSAECLPDTAADERIGSYVNCYLGHAVDRELRHQGSSGGMVTATLLHALENEMIDGALVVRMPADGRLTPRPYIARSAADIRDSARSLYCPVPANIALKQILKTPGRFAVVGIPCHLHGIRKAQLVNKKLRRRIVLHLGLFCGWGTPFSGTDFVIQRLGLQRADVQSVAYRGRGWPGGFRITLKNGKTVFQSMQEGWDRDLSAFKVNRCMFCHDTTAELADISYGDAWLPEIAASDTIGANLMVVRSRQGEDMLTRMHNAGHIKLKSVSKQRVRDSQNDCQWKKTAISGRIQLARMLGRKVPDYGQSVFAKPSLTQIRDACVQNIQMRLAARKSLWPLLRATSRLLDTADRLNLLQIPPTKEEMHG